MNSIQNTNIDFYQNLGKLFYAIAAIDKHVRDEELNTLEDIITKEWLLAKNLDGIFNDSTVITIVDTFKWLHKDNEYSADICYKSFINFKRTHKAFFNKKVNTLILKTSSKIAASFSGKNKSELIMLAKLNMELKKE